MNIKDCRELPVNVTNCHARRVSHFFPETERKVVRRSVIAVWVVMSGIVSMLYCRESGIVHMSASECFVNKKSAKQICSNPFGEAVKMLQ